MKVNFRVSSFSGGTIQSLNSDTFRHLRHCPITDINLSECDISRISKDAFRPLRNTSLSFYMNPNLTGSALHDAFYDLNGSPLRRLFLSYVNLSEYTAALFEGLNESNITTLVLNHVFLMVIKKGLFRNLGTVVRLELSKKQHHPARA